MNVMQFMYISSTLVNSADRKILNKAREKAKDFMLMRKDSDFEAEQALVDK